MNNCQQAESGVQPQSVFGTCVEWTH